MEREIIFWLIGIMHEHEHRTEQKKNTKKTKNIENTAAHDLEVAAVLQASLRYVWTHEHMYERQ